MRLTDEEKRIADDVALRLFFEGMTPANAFECAVNYIAARREALGEDCKPRTVESGSCRQAGSP